MYAGGRKRSLGGKLQRRRERIGRGEQQVHGRGKCVVGNSGFVIEKNGAAEAPKTPRTSSSTS